jgi:hypothetical protein
MRQYELLYPHFVFAGVFPRDFGILKKQDGCMFDKLCHATSPLDAYVQRRDVKSVGFVINLDKHGESGSHWVSVLIDFVRKGVFYYDSTSNPPHRDILLFMQRVRRLYKLDIEYNVVERQFENTECGVFSMAFIVLMLETNLPFKSVCNLMGKDDDMNMLRNIFFAS